ncbi:AAA family ATPase [Candidatus Micrarchaeota archaeon]|nr:AAA family ATPase [Candidatus Micrarchaeota archaeon]
MGERKKTGISGLDKALNGGIPNGNIVLISGGAGTGKTTLCLQFLVEGAKNGEKTLYISTEQNDGEIKRQAEPYGWQIAELEEKNLFKVLHVNILKDEDNLEKIKKTIEELKPERIVLDSLSTYSDYTAVTQYARELLLKRGGVAQRAIDQIMPQNISEKVIIKRMLATLINDLKSPGATTLITSELPETKGQLSSDGISEFLADGVILLYYWEIGEVEEHAMKIRKMRYTPHDSRALMYNMSRSGIEVKAGEI